MSPEPADQEDRTMASMDLETELQGKELWRRQCARNVMDCYALGMEALSRTWGIERKGEKALETLTRLMVEGMTAVRSREDEAAFYRMAAGLCRECAEGRDDRTAGLFRIYAAVFGDMAGEEG
jgi:hypothetical protein